MSKLAVKHVTREEWLNEAVKRFRPWFRRRDLTIPRGLKALCSFPTDGDENCLGQCLSPELSKSGKTWNTLVSPTIEKADRALDVLLHELIHASGLSGHGKDFGKAARSFGLTGKMTATVASPELKKKLEKMVEKLGAYPHEKINNPRFMPKPKQNHMVKLVSPVNEKFSFWMYSNKIEKFGTPLCPECMEPMIVVEKKTK